jgi:hypothetical protein
LNLGQNKRIRNRKEKREKFTDPKNISKP